MCLRLKGELDLATTPAICGRVSQVAQDPKRVVILDLAELSFVDIAGARALRVAIRDLRAAGHILAIVGARRNVAFVLDFVGPS